MNKGTRLPLDTIKDIKRLAGEGLWLSAIARHLKLSNGVVQVAAKQYRIDLPTGKRSVPSDDKGAILGAIKMVLEGSTIQQATFEWPVSSRTLRRALEPYRHLIADRPRMKRASNISAARCGTRRNQSRTTSNYFGSSTPRCSYHDCQAPLKSPGVCTTVDGNQRCVARGPRITSSCCPPWGWLVDEDMIATPDPYTIKSLARMVEMIEAGIEMSTIAKELGWAKASTVERRMKESGEMYKKWLNIKNA